MLAGRRASARPSPAQARRRQSHHPYLPTVRLRRAPHLHPAPAAARATAAPPSSVRLPSAPVPQHPARGAAFPRACRRARLRVAGGRRAPIHSRRFGWRPAFPPRGRRRHALSGGGGRGHRGADGIGASGAGGSRLASKRANG
eukprot:scaffold12071_cov101-Isochrysis_galbana.AAC.3